MRAGFAQFAAFDQDVIDNRIFVGQGKLTMPVLAVGGEKSFGATMAVVMRAAASDVQELVRAFGALADGGATRRHGGRRTGVPRSALSVARYQADWRGPYRRCR
jgi:hypothetical protein